MTKTTHEANFMLFFLLLSTLKTSSWHQKPQTLDTVIIRVYVMYTQMSFSCNQWLYWIITVFPSLKIKIKNCFWLAERPPLEISGKVEIIECIHYVICIQVYYILCALTQIGSSLYTILFIIFTTRHGRCKRHLLCHIIYTCIKISL